MGGRLTGAAEGARCDADVIDPAETRNVLGLGISATYNAPMAPPKYGVFRM